MRAFGFVESVAFHKTGDPVTFKGDPDPSEEVAWKRAESYGSTLHVIEVEDDGGVWKLHRHVGFVGHSGARVMA